MTIWSINAAPSIIGNDLRNISATAKSLLLNDEVIAIDRDPMGKAGLRVTPKGGQDVWARQLSGGDMAVALFNKGGATAATADINFTLKQVGCCLTSVYTVTVSCVP